MSASSDNRAWRRSSQQIPLRNNQPSTSSQREDSSSRNTSINSNKENSNMVRKAQNPSPAPTQNPWKTSSGPAKGSGPAATLKEKAPAVGRSFEQPIQQQQSGNGFNADDIRKMFDEDAKAAIEGLGEEASVKIPEESKKQVWGTQRKPGTMANGQSFATEFAKQLTELEQNKPSP